MISTHTPVKGVTIVSGNVTDTICISTHTPVKGVTFTGSIFKIAVELFQPTHP